MPEPHDRSAFLATVADKLDLPEAIARDVLDELSGHLDDAAAGFRERGDAPEDAERRAISRLGDPALLASDLSRARHGRRRLLAAAGGGIRGVLVEGVRVYVFLLFALVVASLLAAGIVTAIAQIRGLGLSASASIGVPWGSLPAVAAVIGAFAYVGWVLPARVAAPALRSVRGVRRAVAVAGLAAGSIVIWILPTLALDPVLAGGLPLAPLAFAVTALRAPERPTFRPGLTPGILLALALVIPMTLLAVTVVTGEPGTSGWSADTSAIGETPDAVGLGNANITVDNWVDDRNGAAFTTIDLDSSPETVVARVPTLLVEVWPASIRDGVMRFGDAPLAVASAPTTGSTGISWTMPRFREPVTTVIFVLGTTPDGRRVLLGEDLDLRPTPPWTGTLAAWWFGG